MKYIKNIEMAVKLVIVLFLIFTNISLAGDHSKYGTSAAPELLIPVGSIGTSLSGSNLSSITGIESMYWNPAGLSMMNSKTEVMASHLKYIADINIEYLAGAVDLGGIGVIGASIKTLGFANPELVTTEESPDGTGETWTPTYLTTSLTYARKMSDKILFGATVKVIYEQIASISSTGFATDFGLQYVAGKSGLKFGVALKNFGPSMKFDGTGLDAYYQPAGTPTGTTPQPRRITLQSFNLPTTLEIGLSYNYPIGKKNSVELSTTFQNNNYSSDEYRIGLEYVYNKMVYLRGAYTFYPDLTASNNITVQDARVFGPTFGAGIHYPFGSLNLGIDYAYRVTDKFAANQWFSLTLGF
jgi:hypothetical protein